MGLSSWSDFMNPKSKLDAESFVRSNLFRLSQLFNMEEDLTTEEKEEILIKYLTKFPDQIKSLNLQFPEKSGSWVPKTNNIGGIVKYR